MADRDYHTYLVFDLDPPFRALTSAQRRAHATAFTKLLEDPADITIDAFATLGFKAGTTFMLWCRAATPDAVQNLLPTLLITPLGPYLRLTHTYFGMNRPSPYSGRRGRPEQDSTQFTDRLPYFIVYPFSKTHDWHQLPFDERRSLMGKHVKVGLGFPDIRQCLLYSYGVDDYEFVVSYETASLELFQDLVMQLRPTAVRPYTLTDTPIHTGIYKTPDELAAWL
jgi:chlorite dismutase